MPTEYFRSEGAYRRNLAYRHMHGIPYTATRACIRGHGCHVVNHQASSKARKAIDARQRRKVAARARRREDRRHHSERRHVRR